MEKNEKSGAAKKGGAAFFHGAFAKKSPGSTEGKIKYLSILIIESNLIVKVNSVRYRIRNLLYRCVEQQDAIVKAIPFNGSAGIFPFLGMSKPPVSPVVLIDRNKMPLSQYLRLQ